MDSGSSHRGKFIIVLGPTGSGKSVLITHVREAFPHLVFPTSVTTREKRPGHENDSYRFLTVEEFEKLRDGNELLEWAQYGHNYYGTLKLEVNDALAAANVLLKEMEVQGVRQVQSLMPAEELVLMYVDAGSWEELERRVRARAPITEEELAKRKKRYEDEVPFKDAANYVISNPPGGLEQAKKDIARAIQEVIDSVNE